MPEATIPLVATVLARVSDPRPEGADRHPALVYLSRLTPRSRRTMAADLDRIAGVLSGGAHDLRTLAWQDVRYQHAQALRARLSEAVSARTGRPLAPATVNRMLAGLRGVLAECWRLGLLDAESYHRAVDVHGLRDATLPRGRALDGAELGALFAACAANPTPAGARDAALLALLHTGLRRAELVAVDLADLDPASGRVAVRHGKGNRARTVYLSPGGREALEAWLAARGDAPGPLLWPSLRGGGLVERRLSAQAVLEVLGRLCACAGVAPATPHDLRRSTISDLLDAGVDISTVQRLAGHAQVTTTARYDRRGEEVKARAAGLLHTPYLAPAPPGRDPGSGGPRGP